MAVTGTNKYQIIVSASIEESKATDSIKKSLEKISKDITFKIMHVEIDEAALKRLKSQIETVTGLTSEEFKKRKSESASPKISSSEYQQARGLFNTEVGGFVESTRDSVKYADEAEKKLISGRRVLTDMAGQTRIISYGWEQVGEGAEKHNEFVIKSVENINDGIKVLRQQTAEEKKINDLIERRKVRAEEGIAGTQERSKSNPLVARTIRANQAVIDYANTLENQGTPATKEQIKQLNSLSNAATKAEKAMNATGKATLNMAQQMGEAVKKTIIWAGAMTLLYGSLRQLATGTQYIKDLNKELISVRLVTGATAEDTAKLAKSYSDLAMELGSTTLEVARGSLEFYRQGKTAEDTATLLRTSTMMSKLANLEAAQSTEYMTSMMNGFKLESQDMMGVLDSLISLDNAYATSVGEIASAMSRSSVSAQQAGVSLTDLASYITVISSVSRKSAIYC